MKCSKQGAAKGSRPTKGAMTLKILLLDRDTDYAKRFANYMSKNTDMQVSVCDSLDAYKERISDNNFQIILFDAEFDSEKPEDYRKKQTAFAFLSAVRDQIGDVDTIYKYQSISKIYAELMQIYADHTKHEVKTDDEGAAAVGCSVITFIPVCGGAGSSTMAMAAACKFAGTDKVLYLNLEQCHAETLMFPSDARKCITDIVATLQTNYQVKEAKKLFENVMQTSSEYGENLRFIKGFLNIEDYAGLTPANVTTLIDVLRKQFTFRYIIIDTDFILSENLRRLILASDKLVCVSTGTDAANVKIEAVHRFLEVLARESDAVMPQKFLLFNQYYGCDGEDKVARDMTVAGRFGRFRTDDRRLMSQSAVTKQILEDESAFSALS